MEDSSNIVQPNTNKIPTSPVVEPEIVGKVEGIANPIVNPSIGVGKQNTPQQTEPNQIPQATVITEQKKSFRFKKILIISLIIVGILAIGGGGYYFVNFINKPVRIKEDVSVSYTFFEDYQKSIEDIIEDLKDESSSSGFDSDSFERDVQKSNVLLETASASKKSLITSLDGINLSELKNYKENINSYIETSEKLLTLHQGTVDWGKNWIEPMKKYEKLSLDAQGLSNYMLSDPDKYLEELSIVITDLEAVIASLKDSDYGTEVNEINSSMTKNLEAEVEFLKSLHSAVENRNVDEIALSQNKYANDSQENVKNMNRAVDAIDEKVKGFDDDLKDMEKEVNNEYSRLKGKYNF